MHWKRSMSQSILRVVINKDCHDQPWFSPWGRQMPPKQTLWGLPGRSGAGQVASCVCAGPSGGRVWGVLRADLELVG